MNNIHNWEAGVIAHNVWIYFLNDYAGFTTWQHHNLFFFPLIGILGIFLLILYLAVRIWNIKRAWNSQGVLLEITPPSFTDKSPYTTQQLFSVIHTLGIERNIWNSLLGAKSIFSFEIASTKTQGIRYFVRTTEDDEQNVRRSIISYLPSVKVNVVDDYLHKNSNGSCARVIEFAQTKHFAYPLEKQNILREHDPVAYITGMMTKLEAGELISFQIVLSPTKTREASKISMMILRNQDVLAYLDRIRLPAILSFVFGILTILVKLINKIGWELQGIVTELTHGSAQNPAFAYQMSEYQQQLKIINRVKPARTLSSFEEEAIKSVQEKVDQSLFEASVRALIVVKNKKELRVRIQGLKSSFAPFTVPKYQSLRAKNHFPYIADFARQIVFDKRLLSLATNNSSSLFSVSEIADLYHFPYSNVTQTENIVKSYSKELPAPLSLKQQRDLDVIFGINTYGQTQTPIGLTAEERKTHLYMIGRTGSGKTTAMFAMAKGDIERGRGMAFVDAEGDVSGDLLSVIPASRTNDLIYFNPADLKHPIGINLLELTPGLSEDEAELEKEIVAEGVVSLFKKVFSKDEQDNAHRIEYILRNTIHTAFTVPEATIFTVYELLNDPKFLKSVIKNLDDENLLSFWKNEFGRAGDYQVVKMVGGVTAKIGRFLFSPVARRILEQKKSTINFDHVLNGKILICNLSQGKLGDDTARLLGTTILTKIQQAALRRANLPEYERRGFHLYVDEFQEFATLSFAKMLSRIRKYGVDVCIAQQSTSQQQDRSIVDIILANITTLICFRTGNPLDEELMLAQFFPYVQKGEIMNLPRYSFYIKISAIESQEPFSGQTLKIYVKKDTRKIAKLIEASQKNWAIEYVRPKKKVIVKEPALKDNSNDKTHKTSPGSFLPKKKAK